MDMSVIKEYIHNQINARPSLNVVYGVVISIEPLKIKLNKELIIEKNQILFKHVNN